MNATDYNPTATNTDWVIDRAAAERSNNTDAAARLDLFHDIACDALTGDPKTIATRPRAHYSVALAAGRHYFTRQAKKAMSDAL